MQYILCISCLQKIKEQIQGLHDELNKTPVTLEELKQVLNTINNIRSSSMVMELRYTDLEERFRYALCGHVDTAYQLPCLKHSTDRR